MRLFIALKISDEAVSELRRFSGSDFHITLKFLGDADPSSVLSALSDVEFERFSLTLDGLGAFPNPDHARVLWAGVTPKDELSILKQKIDSVLPDFRDDHPFHPHITLKRFRNPVKVDIAQDIKRVSFDVSEFYLFSSTLTAGGPIYSVVGSFKSKTI